MSASQSGLSNRASIDWMMCICRLVVLLIMLGVLAQCRTPPDATQSVEPASGHLIIRAIDVGQGDSFLLTSPAGKNVLIDAGPPDASQSLIGVLMDAGVRQLDLVVATHPHADHIGGMARVLDAVPVKLFLDSGQPYSTKTYTNMLKKIQQKNIPFLAAEAGQEFELDAGIKLQVMAPRKPFITASQGSVYNANSVVIRVTYNSFAMLFTGDSEQETERRLLAEQTDLSATILKVAHHGSKYSTTIAFLRAVQPKVAIISCGAANEYGHPAQRTLDRLKSVVQALHRTDLEGTITIYTDGASYRIETERPAYGELWLGRSAPQGVSNSEPARMMDSP